MNYVINGGGYFANSASESLLMSITPPALRTHDSEWFRSREAERALHRPFRPGWRGSRMPRTSRFLAICPVQSSFTMSPDRQRPSSHRLTESRSFSRRQILTSKSMPVRSIGPAANAVVEVLFVGTWSGTFRAVSEIYRNGGMRGLLQGHSVTLLRVFPYAAIKFMAYDQVHHVSMV